MKSINQIFLAAALLCMGSVTLAGSNIPGVDVKLGKNPGGSKMNVKTDANGEFQFRNLQPGNYDLCVADEPCKLIVVGKEGAVSGQVKKHNYKGVVTLLK